LQEKYGAKYIIEEGHRVVELEKNGLALILVNIEIPLLSNGIYS